MKNWKTTLTGISMILAAVAEIISSVANGKTPAWQEDFIAICGGIGLLFAKDFNVTGGKITQPTVSNPPSLIEK
jgi:hypothetical protein